MKKIIFGILLLSSIVFSISATSYAYFAFTNDTLSNGHIYILKVYDNGTIVPPGIISQVTNFAFPTPHQADRDVDFTSKGILFRREIPSSYDEEIIYYFQPFKWEIMGFIPTMTYIGNTSTSYVKSLHAKWHPATDLIAFSGRADSHISTVHHIYTNYPDGSNRVQLTTGNESDYWPTWNTAGTKIAFVRQFGSDENPTHYGLMILDLATHSITNILNTSDTWSFPQADWSSSGNKLTFAEDGNLYTINPDGTGRTEIASIGVNTLARPMWGPNDKIISFYGDSPAFGYGIYVVLSSCHEATPGCPDRQFIMASGGSDAHSWGPTILTVSVSNPPTNDSSSSFGSENLQPIPVQPSWNLVSDVSAVNWDSSTCTVQSFSSSWGYDKSAKSYVRPNKMTAANLKAGAVWLKAKESCTLSYDTSKLTTTQVTLKSGVNFVGTSESMAGTAFPSCVTKAYLYDTAGKKWSQLTAFPEAGKGVILKATGDCVVGEEEPPEIES